MKKLPKPSYTEAVTRLLRRINQGVDPTILRKEASRLFNKISPSDIADAEQKLISSGYSSRLAGQLSIAFMLMGILDGKSINLKSRLPVNHIVSLIISEHELTRCYLADLEDVSKEIYMLDTMTETSSRFMRLSRIIEHLYAMQEHFEREDDVLFPTLQKYGWTSLCRSAMADHRELIDLMENLIRLIGSYHQDRFKTFKDSLISIVDQFCWLFREHIFQEDNLLYPIAIEVIPDKIVWDQIKEVCDDIGYSGVHL